jgi:nucleoside-diphosphate-sugar epimerase
VPPRLLFTSTLDVHGNTLGNPPPRHVDDPLVATNPYTEHKIEGERLVRESGLDWAIFRLADVPVLGIRPPHPIMFEIGLDNRIEAVHADDVGLAIANALETPEVWGRVLFIGGGLSCQLTYREYLTRMLAAMGVGALPEKAFSTAEYATDWLDTVDSEALLHYQRHTFDDITAALSRSLGWRRRAASMAGPLVRLMLLRLSAYYRG